MLRARNLKIYRTHRKQPALKVIMIVKYHTGFAKTQNQHLLILTVGPWALLFEWKFKKHNLEMIWSILIWSTSVTFQTGWKSMIEILLWKDGLIEIVDYSMVKTSQWELGTWRPSGPLQKVKKSHWLFVSRLLERWKMKDDKEKRKDYLLYEI